VDKEAELSKVDFHWRSAFPSGIEFAVAIHSSNRGKVAETHRRFLSWDTIAKLDELRVFLAPRIRYLDSYITRRLHRRKQMDAGLVTPTIISAPLPLKEKLALAF
jgi:hypothetical protein